MTQAFPVTVCFKCGREPDEIPEYVSAARVNQMTPREFVAQEEGTLNIETGRFCCTECYIAIGQPSSPTGWKAP